MRYALFANESHYPWGGWYDLVGIFPSMDDAKDRWFEGFDPGEEYNRDYDWGHIVDLTTAKIVLVYALDGRGFDDWDWIELPAE